MCRMKTYSGKRPYTPTFLVPDHREAERRGEMQRFRVIKRQRAAKKSNAFVNLYEFHLKCYGIKLNPMHGCSGKSCRDISVQLMVVQTASRRGWEAVPLRTFTRFKWF